MNTNLSIGLPRMHLKRGKKGISYRSLSSACTIMDLRFSSSTVTARGWVTGRLITWR